MLSPQGLLGSRRGHGHTFNELKAMAVGDKDLRLKTSEKWELIRLRRKSCVKTWRSKGGKFMANVHLTVGDPSQPKHLLKGESHESQTKTNSQIGDVVHGLSFKSREMAVQAACINAMRKKQYLGV